jgi:hypothetical protein
LKNLKLILAAGVALPLCPYENADFKRLEVSTKQNSQVVKAKRRTFTCFFLMCRHEVICLAAQYHFHFEK